MILTIDIGSSSVRAMLFSRAGEEAGALSRRPHTLRALPDGGVEADAEHLFDLVVQCIDETLAKAESLPGRRGAGKKKRGARAGKPAGPPIEGVVFCTFLHSMVGVARDGRPMTPLYTWADTRPSRDAVRFAAALDPESVHQRTGCIPNPSYLPAKLLWLRRSARDTFKHADWWCSIGEYCCFRLLGRRVCSLSIASGAGLLDIRRCRWDPEVLDVVGVPVERLSTLADTDFPLSGLVDPFAGRWPLLRDVPWFPALGDGVCSNIGSGCATPARMAVMVGTTGAMRVIRREGPIRVPRGLWCYRVDRKRIVVGGVLGNAGNLYAWMNNALSLGPAGSVEAELMSRPPAGHGLTLLPFLTGERSPGWNPEARAAILGMGLGTTPLDILQAGMEGVAYRFAAVLAALGRTAAEATEVVGTGGALYNSAAWTQIIADVLGRPVIRSRASEASARGAALLALESLGCLASVEDAPAMLGDVFNPRPEHRAAHRRAALAQERAYRKLFSPPR